MKRKPKRTTVSIQDLKNIRIQIGFAMQEIVALREQVAGLSTAIRTVFAYQSEIDKPKEK